jgi:two-component system sensor histidine kinase QseC
MTQPRPRSLQARLLALTLGLVLSAWLASALVVWLDTRHELDELLDAHLAQAAALLVAQQVHEMEDGPGVDAPSLHRYAPKVAFQVFHEGRLVLRSANAPVAPLLESKRGGGSSHSSGLRSVRIEGQDWRVFAAHGNERDVQVYVGEQLASRASIVWAVLRGMLTPMLLALPLLALALWWAVRRGTQPLRALGAQLRQRSPDSLLALQLPDAPAEMRPMLDALNALFERIAALLEAERRFTADAAHELRTPIAAIRAQAQVALGASEDGERRHALQATLQGCDRASRLVEQMLTLARLEAEQAPAGAPLDLLALARRVLAELAPAALQQGQDLTLEGETPCPVRGNETLLAVLLRNLVDNALRYSPPGARVLVSVSQAAGLTRLLVADSGPGLDEAQCQRLGERFFRVLGSGRDGSGLGWSIVRRIAKAQGASIELGRSAELGGLEVKLSWPAA